MRILARNRRRAASVRLVARKSHEILKPKIFLLVASANHGTARSAARAVATTFAAMIIGVMTIDVMTTVDVKPIAVGGVHAVAAATVRRLADTCAARAKRATKRDHRVASVHRLAGFVLAMMKRTRICTP